MTTSVDIRLCNSCARLANPGVRSRGTGIADAVVSRFGCSKLQEPAFWSKWVVRMRILYALDSYRPNIDGVAVSVERQALGLLKRGHDVAILAPSQAFEDYEEEYAGVKIFRVHSIRLILDRWRLVIHPLETVERVFDAHSPDVVVATLPFPLNKAAIEIGKKRGLPIVGITGTMPEWLIYNVTLLKPFSRMLNSTIWRHIVSCYDQCDIVVAVSSTAENLLLQHNIHRPTTVISNGVPLRDFRPRPRARKLAERLGIPDKPCVLYTGRLDSEKCMDVWIKAIPTVIRSVDAHFVVGGDGSERGHLIAAVAKMGLADRVTFTGFLEYRDYCQLYSLATVFAIASPSELQSIVTLEAASSGLPIVAVNAGALPELVDDGRNGFLFDEGNSEQMAGSLISILTSPELARRLGQESRRIAEKHDFENSILKYEALYKKVLTDAASTNVRR